MNHLVWSPLPLHPRWSTVLMAALLLADSLVAGVALWENLSNQPVPPNNPQIETFNFGGMSLTKSGALVAHNNDTVQTARAVGTFTYSKS